jgi:hypothetical protein
MLPPTIEVLQLGAKFEWDHFELAVQRFPYLRVWDGPSDWLLNRHSMAPLVTLEHLTTLAIHPGALTCSRFIPHLPPSLTSLTLLSEAYTEPGEEVTWPSNIRTLSIQGFSFLSGVNPFVNCKLLPTTITALCITDQIPPVHDLFQNFGPMPQLKTLEVDLGKRNTHVEFSNIPDLSKLKLHLRNTASLRITNMTNSFSSNLTSISLSRFDSNTADAMGRHDWPIRLTELNLSSRTAFTLSSLPDTLKHLTLAFLDIQNPQSLEQLPSKLHSLEIRFCKNVVFGAVVASLPRTLASLSLFIHPGTPKERRVSVSQWAQLPQSLDSLECLDDDITDTVIPTLPRFMSHLRLPNNRLLTNASMALLPPTLQICNLIANPNITPECWPQIPKTLRAFAFGYEEFLPRNNHQLP